MKEVISYFFHKNTDLASIASVGAAVGIGILFVFALHRWSVPSLAQEPIPRRVWEYGEELGFFQMRMSTPRMPIDISRKLRFFDQQAIESLPGGGHSWVELARTVISRTISPDLTDIDILAYAYCILMEKGQSNEIMTEALKIQLLWLQGLSIS
jgi:hypothetical protein